eukprot:3898322-Pyramimonas_sp.AAC.1
MSSVRRARTTGRGRAKTGASAAASRSSWQSPHGAASNRAGPGTCACTPRCRVSRQRAGRTAGS